MDSPNFHTGITQPEEEAAKPKQYFVSGCQWNVNSTASAVTCARRCLNNETADTLCNFINMAQVDEETKTLDVNGDQHFDDAKLALQGIRMILNNEWKEAEELYLKYKLVINHN